MRCTLFHGFYVVWMITWTIIYNNTLSTWIHGVNVNAFVVEEGALVKTSPL